MRKSANSQGPRKSAFYTIQTNTMDLKKITDVDLKGKTVLFRVAYDIGPVEQDGSWVVKDTARIEATLPTLRLLLENKCKIALLSWVKRPGGKKVEKLSTKPHAAALSKLIGKDVAHIDECAGPRVQEVLKNLGEGEMLMLENSRFHPGEEANDPELAREMAAGYDLCVYDAFGHAHRTHASTVGVLSHLPSVAGLLMQREMGAYDKILSSPNRPLVAVLGGAKISDKLDTMRYLLDRVDILLVGGALANTFLKGLDKKVGGSLVESATVDKDQAKLDFSALARELYETAPVNLPSAGFPVEASRKLVLPVDLVAAPDLVEGEEQLIQVDNSHDIPDDWKFLDIGPATRDFYSRILHKAKTIFWNGPMGYFELEQFGKGTRALTDAAIDSDAYTIVAGGDTETIIDKYGLEGKFDHVSTGGGVSLRLLAGKELPVIKFLTEVGR